MKNRKFSIQIACILSICSLLFLFSSYSQAADQQPVDKVLSVGESTVLVQKDIHRIAVADPQIADVVAVSSSEVLVNAKSPGNTLLRIWGASGRSVYRIMVRSRQLDLISLSMGIQREIKDPRISVRIVGNTLMLEGAVSSEAESRRAETIARAMVKSAVGSTGSGVCDPKSTPSTTLVTQGTPTSMQTPVQGIDGMVVPEIANYITVNKVSSAISPDTETSASSVRALLNDPALTVRALPGNVVIVDGKVGTQAEYNHIDSLIASWSKGPLDQGATVITKSPDTVRVINNVAVDTSVAKQILVHVRVVDMDKTASKDLGVDWGRVVLSQSNVTGQDAVRSISDQPWLIGQSGVGSRKLGDFSDFTRFDPIGARVSALIQQNKAKVLAEPNLLVLDSNEASMLVGGEIPIPIAQSTQSGTTVTIEYKEFGVRLRILPKVTSGTNMQLKLAPEVSALDFANGVVLNGFSIPALRTRKAETTVNISSGQSLVIGGLIQKETSRLLKKIPLLGDLPVLGAFFRSKSTSDTETELMIMVTPELVTPKPAGETGAKP